MNQENKNESPISEATDKLVSGYNTMIDKLSIWTEKADESAGPMITNGLKETEKFFSELPNWTAEEVDLLSRYVKRDLHDAATRMEQQNKNFQEWLELDFHQIEDTILEAFSNMADQTRLELNHIKDMANEWHTGEVTSIGTIACAECGKELHFHKPGRIPPCPSCYHTTFIRKNDE